MNPDGSPRAWYCAVALDAPLAGRIQVLLLRFRSATFERSLPSGR